MPKVINVNMAPSTSELVSILIVLAIPFLYEMSSAFRYHFKFIVYYLYVTTISIFMIPIMALRPKDCQNAVMASRFCRVISPLLGIDWKLRGEEYFGMQGPCVIVANHQSSLDILGMFEFWHVMGKCTIVAKKELMYAWPFGLAAWLCGLTFVDRTKSDEARQVMNSSAQLIKSEKVKMWVFPEGTRKNTGELHSFKKGAFHVAVTSQIPIQPVVFSPFYFLDNKERTFNQGTVIMTALPPISTEGLQVKDVNVLVERVRGVMLQEFNRVAEEIYDSLPVTVTVSCKKVTPKVAQTLPSDQGQTSLTSKDKTSLTNKEQLSLNDMEKAPLLVNTLLAAKERSSDTVTKITSFTDKERTSFINTDRTSRIDKGNASCIKKEKTSFTGTEGASFTKEKTSFTDKEKSPFTDEGKTALTDEQQNLFVNKDKTAVSDKEQSSLTDKKSSTNKEQLGKTSAGETVVRGNK